MARTAEDNAHLRQQQMLQLDGLISKARFGSSGSQRSNGSIPQPPPQRRPSGIARPRPGTPRSYVVVQPDARAEYSHASTPKVRREEFEALRDLIGSKAAERYKSMVQALRQFDLDSNGMADRHEVRHFFRQFNLPQDCADKFFNYLSVSNRALDLDVVRKTLEPYITSSSSSTGASYASAAGVEAPRSFHRSVSPPKRYIHPQAPRGGGTHSSRAAAEEELVRLVGMRAHQKFRNTTDAFRASDDDKDGVISQHEFRRFIERLGMDRSMGDHLFRSIASSGNGKIDGIGFQRFIDTFGPSIQPAVPTVLAKQSITEGRSPRPREQLRVADEEIGPARQRSRSASQRRTQHKGGSSSLRAVRAARELCDDTASLASVSTCDSSGGGMTSGHILRMRGLSTAKGAECCVSPRGDFFAWIGNRSPTVNRTFDSSNMSDRLGGDRPRSRGKGMTTSRSWGPTAWRAAGLKAEPSAGVSTEPTMYEKQLIKQENKAQAGRVTFAADACDLPEEFWLEKAMPTLKRSLSAPPTANKTFFIAPGLSVSRVSAHNDVSEAEHATPPMNPSLSKGSLRMPHYLSKPQDNLRGKSNRSPPETFRDHRGDFKVDMCMSSVDSVASCLSGST